MRGESNLIFRMRADVGNAESHQECELKLSSLMWVD